MVKRDLLVQWRDKWEFVFRVVMLPLILIMVYGWMLPTVGILPKDYPTHMFCGMIGMSMLITGIHGTAVPVSMDFHNLREIEDRLLAPVSTKVVALSKMLVGILESFIGGLIVLPISLAFMFNGISIQMQPAYIPLLILILILTAIESAALGLLVGTIVKPSQIAAMFPGFLMPVVFLGAIFYTWKQLSPLPVMQVITLMDPLTWINEAIRSVMTPQIESLPLYITLPGIAVWIIVFGFVAIPQIAFHINDFGLTDKLFVNVFAGQLCTRAQISVHRSLGVGADNHHAPRGRFFVFQTRSRKVNARFGNVFAEHVTQFVGGDFADKSGLAPHGGDSDGGVCRRSARTFDAGVG